MQTYDFSTSGAGLINAVGDFVHYVSGTAGGADDGIVLYPERGGSRVELQPGQSFRYSDVSQTFRIAPRTAGATVTGRLIVGVGDFRSQRVAGEVAIMDAIGVPCQWSTNALSTAIGFNVVQLVAPNVAARGVVLRSAFLEATAGAGGWASALLIAAATVPPNGASRAAQIVLARAASVNAVAASNVDTQSRRMLPPNWGLWAAADVGAVVAGNVGVSASFEVLT